VANRITQLSDEFYKSLPHSTEYATPVDNKRVISDKQQLCQVWLVLLCFVTGRQCNELNASVYTIFSVYKLDCNSDRDFDEKVDARQLYCFVVDWIYIGNRFYLGVCITTYNFTVVIFVFTFM
jgi:hypothetical protein